MQVVGKCGVDRLGGGQRADGSTDGVACEKEALDGSRGDVAVCASY